MGCAVRWLFYTAEALELVHENTKLGKGTKKGFSWCPFYYIRSIQGSIKIGLIFREEIAFLRSQ